MKASIVRGLLSSSVTVSGTILPTPGSSSSGERSRSASYIGCGKDGPVISDCRARHALAGARHARVEAPRQRRRRVEPVDHGLPRPRA